MKQDLISVIVPIYKMEKFIEKCLYSIRNSSYSNLEIICVDDGSPDSSMSIVKAIQKQDSRIKIVTNKENLGLFRARVEGMKVASGKYVAFVDADDFVSFDWFRLLHEKIVEENADMVIGNTVNVDENQYKSYFNNSRSLTKTHKTLSGNDVLNTFISQEGSCFMWHTVWNKLYSKNLVDECLPYFKMVDFHLVMCEDIAFSSVFYTHAKKLAFADADAYFYYRHSEASTSTTLPKEKILNNIKDIKNVFDFVENAMKSYDKKIFNKNKNHIENFKQTYRRNWVGFLADKNYIDKNSLQIINNSFGSSEIVHPNIHEYYFTELSTPWSDRLEYIKHEITKPEIKLVSFDIFDTLLIRPLYSPDDLFLFVGKFASKLVPFLNEKTFLDLRKEAENSARRKLFLSKPMFEDITLSEIYEELANIVDINSNISKQIMQEECRLETKFCKPRKLAVSLFNLAKFAGKKVVLTSDMYLEKDFVEQLLLKNGIIGFNKLYLSSDKKALKSSGKLFDILLKESKLEPNEILHLGDNWNSDYILPKQKGMQSVFIPKTIETFENKIGDIYTGSALSFYNQKTNGVVDVSAPLNDLSFRSMVALSANKWFDNPFEPFQQKSNFNADVYHTGYYTLGMHFFGVCKWMLDVIRKENYKKVVFLARDGFVIKQIFDYLISKTGDKIQTDYFYASRKCLLPYSIKSAKDIFGAYEFININAGLHTPTNIINMLQPILSPLTEEIKNKYLADGIILDKKLSSKNEFYKLAKAIIKYQFNEKLLKEKRKEIKLCFEKEFTEKTATFDIGYSGRLQSIICDLSNKPVDAFFIHSNGYSSDMMAKNKFKIHSFYDFSPNMSSIVREFIVSAPEPPCTGYNIQNGKLSFVFEEDNSKYYQNFAIKEFQKGAYDFCVEFSNMFDEYLEDLTPRKIDSSLALDYYLLNASEFDRYAFSSATEDDFVYSAYNRESIFGIWSNLLKSKQNNNQNNIQLISSNQYLIDYISKFSKFKRAIFWLLFDRKTFKTKLKKNIKKNKNK